MVDGGVSAVAPALLIATLANTKVTNLEGSPLDMHNPHGAIYAATNQYWIEWCTK
jgi:fructose-1,6-bisphosphatase/inositol monophosphatase family enzyme